MEQGTVAISKLEMPCGATQARSRLFAAFTAAALLGWQLWQHFRILAFPWPLDYRENVVLFRGALAAAGHSPYSQLPFSQSQYGFVMDYLSAPLMLLFGPNFLGPRLVAGTAILLSSLLLAVYAARRSGDRLLGFMVFALAYVASFSHPQLPLATPNALGSLLFLVSVLVPLLGDFRAGALAIGLLAAWGGFFAKLYPGIGPAFVIAYLLVSRAWLKAAVYALCSLALLGASLLFVPRVFPGYFDTTLGLAHAALKWDGAWLLVQTGYFLVLQSPLLAFLIWRTKRMPPAQRWALLTGFSGISAIIAASVLLKIGGNKLQYYLYFHQLLFPFLLLLAVDSAGKDRSARHSLLICLLGSTVLMFLVARQYIPLSRIDASFRAIAAELPRGDLSHVLLDPPAAFFAVERGQIPVDDGQTEFLRDAGGHPHALFLAVAQDVAVRKRSGFYSLVFTDGLQPSQDHSDLARCYRLEEARQLWLYELGIPLQVWIRKAC